MLHLIDDRSLLDRTFRLVRPGVRTLGPWFEQFCKDTGAFAREHGEGQIYAPRTRRLAPLVRGGRLVVMLDEAPERGPQIVGVSCCSEFEDLPTLYEIAMTVVRRDLRRLGLGAALVGALAVQECAEAETFEGLVSVTREDNLVCRAATRAVGGLTRDPVATVRAAPELAAFTQQLRDRVLRGHEREAPAISVLMPPTILEAARMMLAANTDAGLPLKHGAVLKLGAGWDDTGLWPQVEAIARGWLPNSPLWDPSGDRLIA